MERTAGTSGTACSMTPPCPSAQLARLGWASLKLSDDSLGVQPHQRRAARQPCKEQASGSARNSCCKRLLFCHYAQRQLVLTMIVMEMWISSSTSGSIRPVMA